MPLSKLPKKERAVPFNVTIEPKVAAAIKRLRLSNVSAWFNDAAQEKLDRDAAVSGTKESEVTP